MVNCPTCKSTALESLYPNFKGVGITSDMKILEGIEIENRICKDCGLIFNNKGTRHMTAEFYEKSYSLMMATKKASIKNFTEKQPITQAELTFNILKEMVKPGDNGKLLEAGAGKGEFLTHFVKEFPKWEINAFESSSAFENLKENIPGANVEKCQYEKYTGKENTMDLIVALGVLEHVANPLDMLLWGYKLLKENGVFYIRVPNFAKNPNDLFCVDHLSKLTPASLKSLATAAGYEVIDVLEKGVPVFTAFRKTSKQGKLENVYSENIGIANNNVSTGKQSMTAIIEAQKIAESRNENFAIFGLGPVGLFAPFYGEFSPEKINAYLDENESQWGKKIHGREVGGLDFINSLSIKHVALAISPVYYDVVKAKLAKYDVTVYCG